MRIIESESFEQTIFLNIVALAAWYRWTHDIQLIILNFGWHAWRLGIGYWRRSATLAQQFLTQYIANRHDLQLTRESAQSTEELSYIACRPLVLRYADR